MKVLKWMVPVVIAALVTACQSPSPVSRIAENPVLYQSLSPSEQSLVQQGQICRGMSPEAVFLAWGRPNTKPYVGEKDGRRIERWVYTQERPVTIFTDNWPAPYWGPYGGWYGGMGMSTAYVPENAASVLFENGKVVSWESRR